MPADVTTILAAVVSGLAAINETLATSDPTTQPAPILTRQLPAEPEMGILPGWEPGDPIPCWIVSAADPEEDNKQSSTEHRSVDYRVRIDFVRSYLPGEQDEDPVIRDLRKLVRKTLDMPQLPGAAQVWSTIWEDGPAYQRKTAGDYKLTVSVQRATFRVMEPRD